MSSTHQPRLTSDELAIVQKVLCDAGYTGDVLTSVPTDFNQAAKLLIGLVRRGMRDQAALKIELDIAFGRHFVEATVPTPNLHRHAIRGIVTPRPKPTA